MKIATQLGLLTLGTLLALVSTSAVVEAREGILTVIPDDAIGFAVVHDLATTSSSIGEVAKLVQAPAPDLLSMAKTMSGVSQGVDEQGDLAVVVTSIEPAPQGVLLVPIADFSAFFAALKVEAPATGVVEVQLAGKPTVIGRKGDFAVIAAAANRDALEQFLASTSNLASDAELTRWIDASRASIVLPPNGLKLLLPKLISGIRGMQANFRQLGPQGQPAADGLEMYAKLFAAAESEVAQFGVALRINSAHTIDLVKQITFNPDGSWSKLAADIKPAGADLLAGLPADPYVMAMGALVPATAMEHMLKFSVDMMQKQPMYKLSAEQAEKYGALSAAAMRGVQSVEMLIGVAEPGTGFYGNTTVMMSVEDTTQFLDHYEQSMTEMRELAEELKNPMFPVTTTKRIKIDDMDTLEISMDYAYLSQNAPAGGPDMKRIMEFMVGSNSKMTIYMAAADEQTVVMSYSSAEQLQSAVRFFRSRQPGFSSEARVAEVSAALPLESQMVAFVSLDGMASIVRQFAQLIPGVQMAAIPDFSQSPPIGMAAKVSPKGVEGHLVVTADTLRAVGDTIAKARGITPQ